MFDIKLKNELSYLLSQGISAGADFVEYFLENRVHLNIVSENGKITSIVPSLTLGAGVRIFKGLEDCYVSTNNVTPKGLKFILDKALDIFNLSIPSNKIHKEIEFENFRDYGTLKNKNIWLESEPPIQNICDTLLNCNNLQQKIKYCKSATTNGFHDCQEILVASSDGIFARDIRLNQSLSASIICIDDEYRTSCHKRLGQSNQFHFYDPNHVENLVQQLKENTENMLRADYIKSGQYPVVIANQFGGVLFHEACGHLLETTAVQQNSTPFAKKMNEQIAHKKLTAWDDGVWKDGFGSIDMDDEGMPTQKTLLIENGILKNFISDRMGHLLTGYARTGSGRRQNYTYAPASRMRNTYIAPGEFSKDDMISSIENGIYCKSLGGGSVGSTGDFNFAVEEAWLIKNGKVTTPVKGATLIGQAPDVMNKVSMCSNDLDIAAGFCGSVSGSIYVTVGQPHIKVDSMTVGGR